MKDDDAGFLARWSARKQAARHAPAEPTPEAGPTPEAAADEPPPDLPPIDSLGRDSDFTVFLQANVPAALRAAALRRAWTLAPAIAGHKPLVDYDWDFHAPGYGRLRPEDDATALVERLFRHLRKPDAEPPAPPPEPEPHETGPPPQADPPHPPARLAAQDPPHAPDVAAPAPQPSPRLHGGARPA